MEIWRKFKKIYETHWLSNIVKMLSKFLIFYRLILTSKF